MLNKSIFWYIKNPKTLSKHSVLEHTINYGTWSEIQELIKKWGFNETKKIFDDLHSKQRSNLNKMYSQYFKRYFDYHASKRS